ncbi:prokineticin Bm8-d-like [Ixodes scapularis]|uniref:prokineticin Bm8-d-like n=1 Tax=Ixodes scapularis TaxID=6945 RepID=UPI001A9D8BF8|nr:prokineticin Bm8-d-like [Ixodes scapularis]
MKTFCLALALTVIVAALLDDVTADFQEQRPVVPHFPGGPTRRPTPGRKGQPCSPSAPCGSGLCCLRSSNTNNPSSTCQPKGGYGMPCSEDSIKGGTYTLRCPCQTGYSCPYGPNARCQ